MTSLGIQSYIEATCCKMGCGKRPQEKAIMDSDMVFMSFPFETQDLKKRFSKKLHSNGHMRALIDRI